MMTPRNLLCFTAFAMIALSSLVASAEEEDWLEFYYTDPKPERFVEELKGWAKDGTLDNELAKPALISFLSRVIRENREQIPVWYKELSGLTPNQKQVLHTAMLYARVSEADEIMRETFGERFDNQKVDLPKILEMPLDKAKTLDMLWGFFYATGSDAPIRRIVLTFRFEEAPNDPEGVEVPKGYMPLYKEIPNFAFGSLVANAERHPKLISILETFLEKDDSLIEVEKRGVYDVLSDIMPNRYPPVDWEEVDERKKSSKKAGADSV